MDFKCDELILGKTDADSRALTPRRADSEHLEGTDKQEEMASMPSLLTRGNESVTTTVSSGCMM